jgi:long-subunit acyl-CoA synthetase (AMP-forming)
VNGASAAKQYMFKKAMQVSHRRRLHLDKGEEVGSLTAAQHKFFDQLVLSKIRDTFGGNLKVIIINLLFTALVIMTMHMV